MFLLAFLGLSAHVLGEVARLLASTAVSLVLKVVDLLHRAVDFVNGAEPGLELGCSDCTGGILLVLDERETLSLAVFDGKEHFFEDGGTLGHVGLFTRLCLHHGQLELGPQTQFLWRERGFPRHG